MAAFIHLWRHLFASETLFLAYIKFHHATSYVVLAKQKRENWKHLITNNHILQKGLLHCCLGGEIQKLYYIYYFPQFGIDHLYNLTKKISQIRLTLVIFHTQLQSYKLYNFNIFIHFDGQFQIWPRSQGQIKYLDTSTKIISQNTCMLLCNTKEFLLL